MMPLLDKIVYRIVGDAMGWLGRRAFYRRDNEMFWAMCAALEAGHVEGRLKSKR